MSEIDFSKLPDADMWLEVGKSVGLFQLREKKAAESMEKDFGASPSLALPFATFLAAREMLVLGWGFHCTVGVLLEKHPELAAKCPTPSEVVERAFALLTEGEADAPVPED